LSSYWRAEQEWKNQQCFIIGGGASICSQDMGLLKGQKIIVINTSYEAVPWADFLVFSDSRWWDHNYKKLKEFKGKVICTSSAVSGPLYKMHRKSPPGLASDIGTLAVKFTTLSAAINLAVHLGAIRLILLGIDGKSVSGKTHHHSPHPWKQMAGCWDQQRIDLVKITEELRELNIECVNASPDSAWDLWPKVRYEDYVGKTLELAE
jgi:hypothetical protein